MKDKSSNNGMGVLGTLQIIFIVLKCIGTITWSWWAVLIPLWISLGLIVIDFILTLTIWRY